MLMTKLKFWWQIWDVDDECSYFGRQHSNEDFKILRCWWQIWDVGDSFINFSHQVYFKILRCSWHLFDRYFQARRQNLKIVTNTSCLHHAMWPLEFKIFDGIQFTQSFCFFPQLDLSVASLTFWTVKYIWRHLNNF